MKRRISVAVANGAAVVALLAGGSSVLARGPNGPNDISVIVVPRIGDSGAISGLSSASLSPTAAITTVAKPVTTSLPGIAVPMVAYPSAIDRWQADVLVNAPSLNSSSLGLKPGKEVKDSGLVVTRVGDKASRKTTSTDQETAQSEAPRSDTAAASQPVEPPAALPARLPICK